MQVFWCCVWYFHRCGLPYAFLLEDEVDCPPLAERDDGASRLRGMLDQRSMPPEALLKECAFAECSSVELAAVSGGLLFSVARGAAATRSSSLGSQQPARVAEEAAAAGVLGRTSTGTVVVGAAALEEVVLAPVDDDDDDTDFSSQ